MRQRDIAIDDLSLRLYETGPSSAPPVLFLHGWPQSALAWFATMEALGDRFHTLSPDLPGIGGSTGQPRAADKRTLAALMAGLLDALAIDRVHVVGHDVGGTIAYAMMRAQPHRLLDATIVNVSVPGIDPWDDLMHNPYVWHMAFHQVPNLPELLIADHVGPYFDYFYQMLSGGQDAVPQANKLAHAAAHSQPDALRAGLDWYRAFPHDAGVNSAEFDTPCLVQLLYVRGDKDPAKLETYVDGFHRAGVRNIQSATIRDSGHFVAEEQPQALARELARFFDARQE